MTTNPLLRPKWDRPFGLPPFDEISDDHFGPAFEFALERGRKDFQQIADNPASPSFENTIEAMERAHGRFDRVNSVFSVLASADSNDARRTVERAMAPKLAGFELEVFTNVSLYRRIRTLVDSRATIGLSEEQLRVLDLYYRRFVRTGVGLRGEARDRLTKIRKRLAELGTAFEQNLLAEE